MPSKWMDEGENRVAEMLFGSQPVYGVLYLGLYKNTVEPPETYGISNLTEVTGTGYARKALARGSWVITGGLAEYAQQTFSASSTWGNVYGYFLATTNDGAAKLLAIEHFDAPYSIESGKGVKITPKVQVD